MKLDRFFTDIRKTVERILHAFDHNITVQDNFGPSGVREGWTIVSRGPEKTPAWGPVTTTPTDDPDDAEAPVAGPPGSPGPQGPPGPQGDPASVELIVTADYSDLGDVVGDHVVISDGTVVWAEF